LRYTKSTVGITVAKNERRCIRLLGFAFFGIEIEIGIEIDFLISPGCAVLLSKRRFASIPIWIWIVPTSCFQLIKTPSKEVMSCVYSYPE